MGGTQCLRRRHVVAPPPKRCRPNVVPPPNGVARRVGFGGVRLRGGRKLGKLRLWRNTAHKARHTVCGSPARCRTERGCLERSVFGGAGNGRGQEVRFVSRCRQLPPHGLPGPRPGAEGRGEHPSHCKGLSYAAEGPGSLPTGATDTDTERACPFLPLCPDYQSETKGRSSTAPPARGKNYTHARKYTAIKQAMK